MSDPFLNFLMTRDPARVEAERWPSGVSSQSAHRSPLHDKYGQMSMPELRRELLRLEQRNLLREAQAASARAERRQVIADADVLAALRVQKRRGDLLERKYREARALLNVAARRAA